MNDDELDARLRAWGAAARGSAAGIPTPAAAAVRPVARRSRLLPAMAGAAVVLAVAGGVTAAQLSSSGGHRAGPAAGTGAPTWQSVPAHSAGTPPPPPPAGQQQIVFHGLAIEVPARWPLNATSCGTPQRDTVVLPGAVPACLSASHPSVTSVEFFEDQFGGLAGTLTDARATSASVAGRPATRLTGQRAQPPHLQVVAISVPALFAQVVISSPKRSTADDLAATLTVVGADQNGCSAQDRGLGELPTGRPPARLGAGQQLLPGTPTGITVCRYVGGLIEQSTTLDASARAALVSLLNGLPPGVSRTDPTTYLPSLCREPATAPGSVSGDTAGDSEAYLIRASYGSGPDVDVVVRLGWCGDLGASNGTRTAQRTMALGEAVAKLAGESVGFPGDVRPVEPPGGNHFPLVPVGSATSTA